MINPKEKKAINKWSRSFMRPLVPYNLLDKVKLSATQDDGAKLVYAKFYYGIKNGEPSAIPFDGTYRNKVENLNEESLWQYSCEDDFIPAGFQEQKGRGIIITTGKVRKCDRCKGQGVVRCRTCNGKVRWNERNSSGDVIEHVCSCGNGKENCGKCEGYCDLEDVIDVSTSFRLDQTKKAQYTGEVPSKEINKITGGVIYENQFDYPTELVKELLVGGLDRKEMDELNANVLEKLKLNLEAQLVDSEIDTRVIYEQLVSLFEGISNIGNQYEILKNEMMPIRVLIRVENAPVKQIDYTFKEKKYSIWVYGNQNAIWYKQIPSTFNIKMITIIGLLLAFVGIVILTS